MGVFSGKFEKVGILISTGRTGTMALAQYLDACYDHVKALHEPSPSRRLRLASNRYLCGRLSIDDLVRIFAKSRQGLFRSIAQPVYIEANNFLHGFLDAFERLFDKPRIVHIVRDPRTFIRSWINFGVFRGLKGLVVKYHPYWLLKPELLAEDLTTRSWSRMVPGERIAWYWNAVNKELNRGESLFGENYLRLRFEDLFAGDGQTLYGLTDWIGLPRSAELIRRAGNDRINASEDKGFPKWEDWNRHLQAVVLARCGKLMQQYGYDASIC